MDSLSPDVLQAFASQTLDCLCTLQQGMLTWANPAWSRVFGWSPDELLSKPLTDLLHPDDRASAEAAFAGLVAGKGCAEFGARTRDRDGHWHPQHCVISSAGNDRIAVTLRSRPEQHPGLALAASVGREPEQQRTLFQALFADTQDPALVLNTDGTVLLCNPACETTFGLPAARMQGETLAILQPPDPESAFQAEHPTWWRTPADTLPQQTGAELQFGRHDGTTFVAQVQSTVIRDAEQRPLAHLVCLRDLGVQQQIEQLKGEFFSVVSHELRTPLTAINGALGLLQANILNGDAEQRAQMLALAQRNCDRLLRLVNDILDVEKLRSGLMIICRSPIDLRPLVEESLRLNAPMAQSFSVKLTAQVPDQTTVVDADGARLQQVLTNLISNACKFSPPGTEILVAVNDFGDGVRISVRDGGPNSQNAFEDRLFYRFSHADSYRAGNQGGTGLGLAISRAIVEAHDSVLHFDATDTGTTFYFDLPLAR